NLLAAQQKYSEALTAFRESADLAREKDRLIAAQALCNAAATAAIAGMSRDSQGLNGDGLKVIEEFKTSHDKAVLLVTKAQTDRNLKTEQSMLRARQSLLSSLETAESISDRRAASYALGYLGQLYEQDRQLGAALSFSRRAAFAAQQVEMPEALYR